MKKTFAITLAAVLAAASLAACDKPATLPENESQVTSQTTGGAEQTTAGSSEQTTEESTSGGNDGPVVNPLDKKKDFYSDFSDGKMITLSDGAELSDEGYTLSGNVLTISMEGTYVVSGKLSDGHIVINASKEEDVRLVLNGVEITCNSTAPIFCEQVDKLIISVADGTVNTLTDKVTGLDDKGKEISAVIYSKKDTVFNGSGTLNINANANDGIACKDDLKFMGGTYVINAKDDGIVGKESITVRDGVFKVYAKDDGIKSSKDDDNEKGYIYINGGDITVNCSSDAIHAERGMLIDRGRINVTGSYEGIEAQYLEISGGTVSVKATGNGLNAFGTDADVLGFTHFGGESKVTGPAMALAVTGGHLIINAAGDGIDSNGSLLMDNADIETCGPSHNGEGTFDMETGFYLNGGKVIGIGSEGMLIKPDASSQAGTIIVAGLNGKNGDVVSVADAAGNEVLKITAERGYTAVTASHPDMKAGDTWNILVNGSVQASGVVGQY